MKQFNQYINRKLYYILIFFVIVLMFSGLFVVYSRTGQIDFGYSLHIVLVILLSSSLVMYPKYETSFFRIIMISIVMAYFYTLFFLYPETSSVFIFICMIPAISILFFDSRLFYFSFFLNGLLLALFFSYIMVAKYGDEFYYIKSDLNGNIINFIASQVILYLIYYFSIARIKKMQSYYEGLQQAERLRTTGQLAASVAHEIRNPLTVVKGFLQLFKDDHSFSFDSKKKFQMMIEELDAAEHVISQFLTIAKPDRDRKMGSIDIKLALESVTDLVKSYGLLHDNQIDMNIQENFSISINIIEFKQLFINLIKNAIEASKKGDSIFITALRKKGNLEISITDQGCGMSEEEMNSIGTPFYSLKSKGTGLGLMICYNIIEKNNGKIHFTSVKGKGTTVHVRFPLIE
jgi:two-component system, sporulation sensor kinase B